MHSADSDQLLARMELTAQHRHHIDPRERFPLQENAKVMPVHFDAFGFLECNRSSLMTRLVEHRSETEQLAMRRPIDDYFLGILVDGRDPASTLDTHLPRTTPTLNSSPPL